MAAILHTGNKGTSIILATCWCVWTALYSFIIWKEGFSPNISIIDGVVTNIWLVFGLVVINNVFRYYLPTKESLWNIISICLVVASIVVLTDYGCLWLFLKNEIPYIDFLKSSIVYRGLIILLMLGWQALLIILLNIMREQKIEGERNSEIEKLAKDAELFKLRQQLQPHFLFNSLNSINALIGIQPQQARKMIEQLSDFLRGTLRKEDHQMTSLTEELEYLQLYLDIEKVRFGHRLNTIIDYNESIGRLQLPAMVLQPIVENAIKFGLYDVTGEVTIQIKAMLTSTNYLEVVIQNPYDPETAKAGKGTGFGLSAVQRRLYLLFGSNELVTTHAENNLFITTIRVPQSGIK